MRPRHVLLIALAAAACGGKSSSNPDAASGNPDASTTPDGPAAGACAEFAAPAGTIALPGTFDGSVVGKGADLSVAMGACATEVDDFYFEPKGEDTVVKVTGLTSGSKYGVVLTTDDDLSFYVATGCMNGSPGAGQCAVFDDASYTTEAAAFTASAAEEYIVIDNSEDPAPPTTGNFSLKVVAAECTDDTECTTAGKTHCVQFACVECANSFDCTSPTAAVCTAGACGGGVTQCTGDDAKDSGSGDDGPASATTIAAPTAQTPTVVTAAVCAIPAAEGDWYKVVWPAAGDLGIALDFAGSANNLEVGLFDSTGALVDSGTNAAGLPEALISTALPAGTYYVLVIQVEPPTNAAAVAYTLTLDRPSCTNDFACATAAKPVCAGNGLCTAGPLFCTSDDVGDTTSGGDDGPAGARTLTPVVGTPATVTSAVCNLTAAERDLYKVTVVNGAGLDATLTWTGATDLDLRILDSTGKLVGESFWVMPESVKVTYLPAGTYYLEVTKFDQNAQTGATQAYTLNVALTTPQVCLNATDCAKDPSTQLYRGACTTGACHFIAAGARANGQACDSGDDCTSGECSYIPFEANAQKAVCTTSCTTTADCNAVGTGLTCSTGQATNFCVASCGTNLDCGANTSSGTLDNGQPWDYYDCAAATGVCTIK
jgi:hypothetical protein